MASLTSVETTTVAHDEPLLTALQSVSTWDPAEFARKLLSALTFDNPSKLKVTYGNHRLATASTAELDRAREVNFQRLSDDRAMAYMAHKSGLGARVLEQLYRASTGPGGALVVPTCQWNSSGGKNRSLRIYARNALPSPAIERVNYNGEATDVSSSRWDRFPAFRTEWSFSGAATETAHSSIRDETRRAFPPALLEGTPFLSTVDTPYASKTAKGHVLVATAEGYMGPDFSHSVHIRDRVNGSRRVMTVSTAKIAPSRYLSTPLRMITPMGGERLHITAGQAYGHGHVAAHAGGTNVTFQGVSSRVGAAEPEWKVIAGRSRVLGIPYRIPSTKKPGMPFTFADSQLAARSFGPELPEVADLTRDELRDELADLATRADLPLASLLARFEALSVGGYVWGPDSDTYIVSPWGSRPSPFTYNAATVLARANLCTRMSSVRKTFVLDGTPVTSTGLVRSSGEMQTAHLPPATGFRFKKRHHVTLAKVADTISDVLIDGVRYARCPNPADSKCEGKHFLVSADGDSIGPPNEEATWRIVPMLGVGTLCLEPGLKQDAEAVVRGVVITSLDMVTAKYLFSGAGEAGDQTLRILTQAAGCSVPATTQPSVVGVLEAGFQISSEKPIWGFPNDDETTFLALDPLVLAFGDWMRERLSCVGEIYLIRTGLGCLLGGFGGDGDPDPLIIYTPVGHRSTATGSHTRIRLPALDESSSSSASGPTTRYEDADARDIIFAPQINMQARVLNALAAASAERSKK